MLSKYTLYFNTIKYLKPSQVFYRITNKIKRILYHKKILSLSNPEKLEVDCNKNFIIPELDYNNEYLERFSLNGIMKDDFTFINISNNTVLSTAWNDQNLQHLWRYNLHYFEYLYKLAYVYTNEQGSEDYYYRYKYLINNWIDNNPIPYGDGWHPYTISLRITNWISTYRIFVDQINKDSNFNEKMLKSIFQQYQYLQRNLEKDVLGNHYFENIKALIIGSIFFNDKIVKEDFKKELLIQLKEQILEDGMHFELSPMYHKIILEDLIKIAYWLKDEDIFDKLKSYIQQMIDVTYSLEENFGKTPAFNDSADGISKDTKALLEAAHTLFNIKPRKKTSLESSGFYVLEDDSVKLIMDVGDICPSYLPAHGHCDALSYEMSINNSPLIVNSGTYKYENGEWRNYFRSTKAHNTVSIANQEQSQYWGSFRVAKRISNIKRKQFIYKNIKFLAGSYKSYQGATHKRFIGYINESSLIVLDIVSPTESAENFVHFIPGTAVSIDNSAVNVTKDGYTLNILPFGNENIEINDGWYSDQFNKKEKNSHINIQKTKSKHYFGYLINHGKERYEISETNDGIDLIGTKIVTINIKELGDFL